MNESFDEAVKIVACPDPRCAAPAEVLDVWDLWSTDGYVPHLKTLCVRNHWFTAPVDRGPCLGEDPRARQA